MGWQHLRGHTDQIEMFRRTISRERLGQAYLFTGAEGVGKKKFATILSQGLFCQTHSPALLDPCGECSACKQMAAGTHPDFAVVEMLSGKNELLIEQFIGTKERRGKEGLCHDMSLKPMSADRKIAVIDEADKMNDAAANALLKTLEEPPHGSLILLIASNVERMLPTIRSRCQEIRFSPLHAEDIAAILLETGMVESADDAREIAAISDGSLATAEQLGDAELREHRRELFEALSSEKFHAVTTAARIMDGIEAAGSDAAAQRRRAAWYLRFCIDFYRELLECLVGSNSQSQSNRSPQVAAMRVRLSANEAEAVELIGEYLERTVAAQQHLDRKMSVGLCVEALFDDLGRIGRTAAVL